MSNKHELNIGSPYPEEVEELGLDTRLHDANEAAHRVARAAAKVIRTRGLEHVKAWDELVLRVDEYERIVKEGDG